jgi:tetratricopeptide (TPR) repeat protein
MNLPAAILSLALAAGAAWAIGALDDSVQPAVLASQLSLQTGADPARLVSLYSEALRRDSANPNRWADLGDAFTLANRIPEAAYCFQRALDLNRRLPQIWLRDANFHFQTGTDAAALQSAARVLLTVPDYDDVLFNYFDRMVGDPAKVLAAIGPDRRASAAYAHHLIATGQVDSARFAWRKLLQEGLADKSLAASYIDLLLASHRYAAARADWVLYSGGPKDPPNILFNGGFEEDPTGVAFDWRIETSGQFRTGIDDAVAHDGKRSLRADFLGAANLSYVNVTQLAVAPAGEYNFRAWIRTDGITTNECPRLEVLDLEQPSRLDVRTGGFCGSQDWTFVNQRFKVSAATFLIAVRVVRQPSAKFDNKIAGTFWLDSVSVEPAAD